MSVAYIKVRYRSTTTGHEGKVIQGLLTKHGVLQSLLQYHAETDGSSSHQAAVNSTVKLLLEFTEQSNIPFHNAVDMMKAFRYALDHGTVDWKGEDPTELFWKPREKRYVNLTVGYLTKYTDWLTYQPYFSGVILNPIRQASDHEQKLNWCAYHHRKNNSLLKHLKSKAAIDEIKFTREISRLKEPDVIAEEVKRFPKNKFNELIEQGFINPRIKQLDSPHHMDFGSQAMTYLMNFGGLRESEIFHIYLSDIGIDIERNEAVVKVYHPSEGKAPEDGYSDREDYLKRKFGLKPRTQYLKGECLHAGWKDPILDHTDKYMNISFFPPSKAAEFLIIFNLYLTHQRVEPKRNSHPYAFTNSHGRPQTKKNFRKRHTAAVHRIGLKSAKLMGTTEHGHRHAYGYRIAEHGFKQIEIQKMMHHKNPDSCLVYIQKTSADIRAIMRATERNSPEPIVPAPAFLEFERIDIE